MEWNGMEWNGTERIVVGGVNRHQSIRTMAAIRMLVLFHRRIISEVDSLSFAEWYGTVPE
jgi:hypothetical protein